MHTILDEIIFGGQVLETSSSEVLKAVEEISKYSLLLPHNFVGVFQFNGFVLFGSNYFNCRLEAASNSISLVAKSVTSWRSR